MKKPNEIWKNIDGYNGMYQVSNLGHIRSWKNSKGNRINNPNTLKPGLLNTGYKHLTLSKNGVKKYYRVHRLVGEYFVKNPKNKPEINHKNGIKTDNTATNLEWVTSSENQKHAFRIGLCNQKGVRNAYSKLTEEQVLDMRNAYNLGCFSQRDIASAYDVSQMTVCRILRNDTWRHI